MNKCLKIAGLIFALMNGAGVTAQDIPLDIQIYIDTYQSIAVREMNRNGIPASITLAQGIFESGFGKSRLACDANNHFGIKCHKEWGGPTITEDDDTLGECFRVYSNAEESYIDHSRFLMTRDRYNFLFNYPSNDYINWARGLKQAGYATNPAYAEELIKRIEKYQLFQFDDPAYVHVPYTTQQSFANVSNAISPHPEKTLPVTLVNNKEVNVQICYQDPKKPNQVICKVKTTYNNGLQATRAMKEDTPTEIAKRAGVDLSDFLRYNECQPNWVLPEGTYLYFSNKTAKNKLASSYRVKAGDNMWLISQHYGIKESALRKRNLLAANEEPAEKELIVINKKTSNKPQVTSKPVRLPVYNPAMPAAPVVIAEKNTKYEREEILALNNTPISPVVSEQQSANALYEVIELPKENAVATTLPQIKPVPASTPVIQSAPMANNTPSTGRKTHYVEPKQTLYAIAKMYGTTIEQIIEWNNLPDYNIQIGSTIIVGK